MSDSAVILALIGVVGTLGGALGGGLLTWWLTQTTEKKQWRRQHCLNAYTEVLSACESLCAEADRVYIHLRVREAADVTQASEAILEKLAVMYRAAHRVTLLGSSAVSDSCVALTCHCGDVIAMVALTTPKPPYNEWIKARRDDFARLYGAFVHAARSDLDLVST